MTALSKFLLAIALVCFPFLVITSCAGMHPDVDILGLISVACLVGILVRDRRARREWMRAYRDEVRVRRNRQAGLS